MRQQSKPNKTGPDFRQLHYFRGKGWLGFGMVLWGEYFSAPLYTEMYRRFGIVRDEFTVLASLYDSGDVTAKTICAITGRPKNSISRGVSRLMAARRIKRITNPADRRESLLSLLAEGRKLYESIMPMCRERERLLLSTLTTTELAALDRLLMKLLLAYQGSPEGPGLKTIGQLGLPTKIDS